MENEYIEQGAEDIEAVSDDNLSYEEASEDIIEDSAPDELNSEESGEGEIEEGIEIPDEEITEPQIVENAQEDLPLTSGSETTEAVQNDYTEQFAQILDSLDSLQGDVTLNDLNENLISIDANIEQVHKDLVALDRNFKFHSRLEIGLLVAIWGSLIIYFAFSKLL